MQTAESPIPQLHRYEHTSRGSFLDDLQRFPITSLFSELDLICFGVETASFFNLCKSKDSSHLKVSLGESMLKHFLESPP